MTLSLVQTKPGLFEVNGELTFTSLDKDTLQSIQVSDNVSELIVNLGQVTKIDSAALALMVELMIIAKQHNKKLSIQNVPKQLAALAKLTGLDEVIPLTEKQSS